MIDLIVHRQQVEFMQYALAHAITWQNLEMMQEPSEFSCSGNFAEAAEAIFVSASACERLQGPQAKWDMWMKYYFFSWQL